MVPPDIRLDAATIVDGVVRLVRSRARKLKSLTLGAPDQMTGERLAVRVRDLLVDRGVEGAAVDVRVDGGRCRVVAVETVARGASETGVLPSTDAGPPGSDTEP